MTPLLKGWLLITGCFFFLAPLFPSSSSVDFTVSKYEEEEAAIQIKEFLRTLTVADKQNLQILFSQLFKENEFGFTLFGDKPMSFCFPTFSRIGFDYFIQHPFPLFDNTLRPAWQGLPIWKTFHKQFKLKNYTLLFHESHNFLTLAIIINHAAFKNAVRDHLDVFQKYYTPDVTPEKLLEDIASSSLTPLDFLNHHGLLGILLGYEEHNSMLFQKMSELSEVLDRLPQKRAPHNTNSAIFHTFQPLDALRTEYDVLCSKLTSFDEAYEQHFPLLQPLFVMEPVNFAADKTHPQTASLRKKYSLIHEKLLILFQKKDWLEIVLLQLLS